MKKILSLIFILILCLTYQTFAGDLGRLVDMAEVLSEDEFDDVLSELDYVSESHEMDVIIVTVDSLDGKTAQAYADDYYDYNGYADDGILFLISLEERDWAVSTLGYGETAFTLAGIDHIMDMIGSALSRNAFYEAFMEFTVVCDDLLSWAEDGEPYDSDDYNDDYNEAEAEKKPGVNFLISLGIGLIIALISVSTMKGALKSVKMQAKADNYIKDNSLNITSSKDTFLYSQVSKTPRQTSSSGGSGSGSHTSSSGRSHGGSSGKF